MFASSSLVAIVALLSLAITTQAFAPPTGQTLAINNQSGERINRCCTLPAHDDAIDSRIDQVLAEKRRELLSDLSSLKQHHPKAKGNTMAQDESSNDLSDGRTVREALLSSRLDGLAFLNRSEVRPSGIWGAGRGLFATEDIPDGQVVTCYPGDALLLSPSEGGPRRGDGGGGGDATLVWGAHVPTADAWDDDAVFVGTESTPPLTSYSVSVDDRCSVLGHPSLDGDPAYYGHYANDGASMEGLDLDVEGGMGLEESVAAYVSKSAGKANAMHRPFRGEEHMVTVATRDIKAGEEILVTYGPDYWGIPALYEEALFRKRAAGLLSTASILFTFLLSFWLFTISS